MIIIIIDISNVTWERGEQIVIQDISWSVAEGEHWCMLGLNGSGKTSLLTMINGYTWPTKGIIRVLGKTFGNYDLRELRKSIGWVSTSLQEKLYGSETALNIVLSGKFSSIGLYEYTDDNDLTKATELIHTLGCSALINQSYGTLSQGEQQRILIARALMTDPKLLILDEPCTGLDVFAREKLLEMISAIAQKDNGPTLIYVTHHVEEILPCFTKTMLLKEGRIFEAGNTCDVLNSSTMSNFFEVPAHVEQRDGRHWLSVKSPLWK